MNRALCVVLVAFSIDCLVGAKSAKYKTDRSDRGGITIGGKVVGEGDATWQVSIMNKRKLACGGSLLRNNVVLTAAECVKDVEPADLLVRAGTKSFKNGGQLRKVRETVHHPDYQQNTHAYNVALLHLMRPFNASAGGVSRVKLPDAESELPSSISVYGWGLSKGANNITITKNLRFSKAKVYSSKKCIQYLPQSDDVDHVFCAGDRVKRVDVCNDDLGSPAIASNDLQFGVVSSNGACSQSHTTIFTNINGHKSWIQETLREFKASQKDQQNNDQQNPVDQLQE